MRPYSYRFSEGSPPRWRAVLSAFSSCLCLLFATAVMAENQGVIDDQFDAIPDVSEDSNVGFRNGSFIAAPIPFSNPTIGSGLVLGAGYLFSTDETSKPSMIGIAALRSDNGSQGIGLALNLAFNNNRWLFESMFAEADVNYDLYTPVDILPISQDGVFARMSLAYGVTPQLSFGGALRYLETTISPDVPGLPPIPPPFDSFLDVEIASIGVVADWDRRDDTIYATRGGILHAEAFHNVSLSRLGQDYDKAYATYTHHFKLGQSGVLVAHGTICGASSGTPFFDLCGIGVTDAFRGFSATQFIGQRSASLQVEYRHQFTKRFGMVAFGGSGLVGADSDDLDLDGAHNAGGLGVRYRVSKKFPVDFSVDVSHNDLGEDLLYIYVGQRF